MSALFPTSASNINTKFLRQTQGQDARYFHFGPRTHRATPEQPETILSRMPKADVIDVEEVVDSAFTQVTTHLVFNPSSLDSMMATAMLLQIDDGNIKKLVPYDHLTGLDTSVHYESLVLVGVELTDGEFFDRCRRGTSITALAYRNTFEYLTPKKRAQLKNLVDITYPLDEFYDADQAATENCVSFVARCKYQADGIENSRFAQYTEAVGRHTNFTWKPVSVADVPMRERTLALPARMFALQTALRTALFSQDPLKALATLDVDAGADAYAGHNQQTRMHIKRSMRQAHYGPRTRGLNIATVGATDQTYHGIIQQALATQEAVVTFEDTKTYRIWRIYGRRFGLAGWVAKYLKPLEIWTEGAALCVATKVPQHDVT